MPSKTLLTATCATLILIVALLSAVADAALPGDRLWTLDRARETARLRLTRSADARWQAISADSGERLREAEALQTAGRADRLPSAVRIAVDAGVAALRSVRHSPMDVRIRALETAAQELDRLRTLLSWMEGSGEIASSQMDSVAAAMALHAQVALDLRSAGLPSPSITITTPSPAPTAAVTPPAKRTPSPRPTPSRKR